MIDKNIREAVEFILRVKPYSEESLYRKDVAIFFEILQSAEDEERRRIAEIEKQNRK